MFPINFPVFNREQIQRAIPSLVLLSLLIAAGTYVGYFRPRSLAHAAAAAHDKAALECLKQRDEEGAEREWLAALAAWPDDEEALSYLGDFYRANHELEVAGLCYLRLVSAAPHYPHVYCRLAEAASDYGSTKDARSFAEKELKLDPKCVRALVVESTMDRHAGNSRQAEAEGRRAFEANPNNEEAVSAYAEAFMASNPAKALTILEPAMKRMPQSAQVAFDLAWCEDHLASDPASSARALDALRRAESLRPHNGFTHTEACRFLLQQNQVPEALKEGAEAVRDSPFDPQALFVYSQALERVGRHDQASQLQKRFLVLQNAKDRQTELQHRYGIHAGDPQIAHDLITVDVTLGELQDAMIVANLAVAVHPESKLARQDFQRLTAMGASP